MSLPTDKKARKETPMFRGLLKYFPDALAYVARVSFVGNQQHNPGEELHWAKDKSTDHADCIIRHLAESGTIDEEDKLLHSGKLAWRALALLQIELENMPRAELPTPQPRSIEPARINPCGCEIYETCPQCHREEASAYEGDWNTPGQSEGFWRVTGTSVEFVEDLHTSKSSKSFEMVKQLIDSGEFVPNLYKR